MCNARPVLGLCSLVGELSFTAGSCHYTSVSLLMVIYRELGYGRERTQGTQQEGGKT